MLETATFANPGLLPVLPPWALFLVSALYVAFLFAVAYYGDRRAGNQPVAKPWTYSLSLAVYCTSWTFYGAVGRASSSGWDYLPIYLGPLLVFVFGGRLLLRLVTLGKRHSITSVADFVGARYGRRRPLAALVTVIAVVGIVPYIALQLRALDFSFELISGGTAGSHALIEDHAFWFALLLAAFSILFGTREIASSENHHGMVLAIAFESVIKLAALLAVGLFVCFGVFGNANSALDASLALPSLAHADLPSWWIGFGVQTLMAASAILCLPRQFQVTVVENSALSDVNTARRVFPVYLILVSLFVLPIAAAGGGLNLLPNQSDMYVLTVPLSYGQQGLALFAYLGGFSAATSMVIVATIALATMISNELLLPLILRKQLARGTADSADLSSFVKNSRRVAIIVLVLGAYVFHRAAAGSGTLASFGLLSFAAVLQFAPALIGGLYWRGASQAGVLASLVGGFTAWLYCLLIPTLFSDSGLVTAGPFGIDWLRPQALFGFAAVDPLTQGTIISFLVNLAGYVGFSKLVAPGLRERLHASAFLGDAQAESSSISPPPSVGATIGDLQALVERFFGAAKVAEFFGPSPGSPESRADAQLLRRTERLLASALGASSARLAITSALGGRHVASDDLIRLLDETSHALQFSRELLLATLEHSPHGVSVVDAELKLVAWNRRYLELFHYQTDLIQVGRPIEDLMRFNAQRGLLPANDEQIAKRLSLMRQGRAYVHERALPSGIVIEIRGNPMPGGGFVTSYSDITAYKRTQHALQDVNDNLEARVAERTREAEHANEAKTRFLAAASHDLVQPIHAARMFLGATQSHEDPRKVGELITNAESSLESAESLLAALLDISRLDAGALKPRPEHFPLDRFLEPLAREFSAQAAQFGLGFRYRPSSVVVHSDPALLRRIIQNFLSNAVRYTPRGKILLGCRRRRDGSVCVEVCDTGPGIPRNKRREIFEEFRRLPGETQRGERGLGLGLAISERIAKLLGHSIALRSSVGHGSAFTVTLPAGRSADVRAPRASAATANNSVLAGKRVLVLENEPAVLAAHQALLSSWGCEVLSAANGEVAKQLCQVQPPDLALIDFHLDGGESGIDVMRQIRVQWPAPVPGIVITADPTESARAAAIADGYQVLQKPLKPASLRALMSRLLA